MKEEKGKEEREEGEARELKVLGKVNYHIRLISWIYSPTVIPVRLGRFCEVFESRILNQESSERGNEFIEGKVLEIGGEGSHEPVGGVGLEEIEDGRIIRIGSDEVEELGGVGNGRD